MDDESWVELLVTYDELEADMIRDVLEGAGIRTVIRSSKVTPYPVNIGRMGEVKIMVREGDLEAAEEILRDMREGGASEGLTDEEDGDRS